MLRVFSVTDFIQKAKNFIFMLFMVFFIWINVEFCFKIKIKINFNFYFENAYIILTPT